jgi:enamine deaminase RidA (YjgF/YER057c/UK114 family)
MPEGRVMNEHVQPPDLFRSAKLGFTQVVVSPPGRQVWISGQTSCDERGRPVGGDDLAAQTRQAMANLGRALASVGAGPGDVTMVRAYVVGLDPERAGWISPAVAAFFDGLEPPASTWVGVASLIHPAFLIEIEAFATLPVVAPPSD